MRRLVGALVVALLAAATLTAAQAASADVNGRMTVKSVTAMSPGLTTPIEVVATADYAITKLTAPLHLSGDSTVIATVEDFELVSGTATDGVWRSSAVTVPQGRVSIDLLADNAAGGTWRYSGVGLIDNGRDVSFDGFDVGPAVLDADHEEVTYHGRVVTSAADGTREGVPHVTVTLVDAAEKYSLASTSTDDEGRFSATATLGRPATVYAVAAANATYRSAKTGQVAIRFSSFPTRLTITAPEESVIGRPTTVTGRLERQNSAGDWLGLGDAYVWVSEEGGIATRVPTAPDGTYTAQLIPQLAWPQWSVTFSWTDARRGFADSSAVSKSVHASWRSRITGFNASPEPVGVGATVTATGRLLRTSGTGTEEPGSSALVSVQFSTDGKKWIYQDTERTDANGRFTVHATARHDGYWRALVQDPDYLSAVSAIDYVDSRYRTRVTSFNAGPEPVRKGKTITVSGTLQRYTSEWTGWRAFSGQSVKVYFQAKGAKGWTYEGRATTSGPGHFSHGFTAAKDGTWRVTYAGSSSYLAVTGADDHVDVR